MFKRQRSFVFWCLNITMEIHKIKKRKLRRPIVYSTENELQVIIKQKYIIIIAIFVVVFKATDKSAIGYV